MLEIKTRNKYLIVIDEYAYYCFDEEDPECYNVIWFEHETYSDMFEVVDA